MAKISRHVANPMAKKKLPRREQVAFGTDQLFKETDRGLTIVGMAMIDAGLQSLLAAKMRREEGLEDLFKRMFNPIGPLGSVSSKYLLAFLLKFIGPITYQDIVIINDMRNDFAHSVCDHENGKITPLHLKMKSVSDRIKNLSERKEAVRIWRAHNAPPDPDPELTRLRMLLINSIQTICVNLNDHVQSMDRDGNSKVLIP
jgi:hypothetical protein